MDKNLNKKKSTSIIFLLVILILFIVMGATYSYFTWNSNNIVYVNVTTSIGSIGLRFDGGGETTVKGLAPASCTHSEYANIIPITIDRYNETVSPAEVALTLKLVSFTWQYAKPSQEELSNINIAISSSINDCSKAFLSGTLADISTSNSGNTAQAQNTSILTWNYVLPAGSGTQSNNIHEDYYLYVWMNSDYLHVNYGNNLVQDPLEDISFNLTWSASSIDQLEDEPDTLYNRIRDNADITTNIDFRNISSSSNGKGIYRLPSTASDFYPVYYYRGDVTDNNVKFANKCWKIVRTTSSGGIKLVYNGEYTEANKCNTSSSNLQLEKSFSVADGNSLAYFGYMYGTAYLRKYTSNGIGWIYAPDVIYKNGMYTLVSKGSYNVEVKNEINGNNLGYHHYTCRSTTETTCASVAYVYSQISPELYYYLLDGGKKIEDYVDEMVINPTNTNSSVIKSYVDSWYQSNMTSYTSFLEDTLWCNDRTISSRNCFNPDGGIPASSSTSQSFMRMGPYSRVFSLPPSIYCNRNDSFTVSNGVGNRKLSYPVGLLTVDEVMMAGGSYDVDNTSYYLYNGTSFWTMSSTLYNMWNSLMWIVDADGDIHARGSHLESGVRPVISLKVGTTISSGDGGVNTPYEINVN